MVLCARAAIGKRHASSLARIFRSVSLSQKELIYGCELPDMVLYSFATEDLARDWDVATDRRAGGKSHGTVTWHPWEKRPSGVVDAQAWPEHVDGVTKAAPKGHLQSQYNLTDEDMNAAPPLNEGGFLRFSGELSLEKSPAAKRSGFCGTRPQRREWPLDIGDYGSISMRVRTDGRTYALNVEAETRIPDDSYQGMVQIPAGEWETVTLPLHRLTLLGRGQYRVYQRALERASLHAIGVSIADGIAGPFQLDIAWISAVQEAEEGEEDVDKLPRKMPPRPLNGVLEW